MELPVAKKVSEDSRRNMFGRVPRQPSSATSFIKLLSSINVYVRADAYEYARGGAATPSAGQVRQAFYI